MKTRLITLLITLLCSQSMLFSQTNNEISIGQKFHVDSEIYGKSRELFIGLPSDYQDSAKNYPVLYMLFPEWSFDRARSAAQYLEAREVIPGLIMVGICGEDTWNEVFPFKVDRIPTSGGGDKFMNFISSEVIPFIESNYRADSLRILAGFSNSAMFANYVMMHEPDLFKSFILSSPMLGWGDDYDQVLVPMPQFEALLEEKAPENFKWKIEVLENEGHVPYVDVYKGLEYTFKELADEL
jgi:predicted alpha/beta superfamily hydrolase